MPAGRAGGRPEVGEAAGNGGLGRSQGARMIERAPESPPVAPDEQPGAAA